MEARATCRKNATTSISQGALLLHVNEEVICIFWLHLHWNCPYLCTVVNNTGSDANALYNICRGRGAVPVSLCCAIFFSRVFTTCCRSSGIPVVLFYTLKGRYAAKECCRLGHSLQGGILFSLQEHFARLLRELNYFCSPVLTWFVTTCAFGTLVWRLLACASLGSNISRV